LRTYELRISKKASNDFKSILQYTLAEYGENQMYTYSEIIIKAFERIKLLPFAGIKKATRNKEYFVVLVEKHSIIYTIDKDKLIINILMIPHQKMHRFKRNF
jgi:plasmid stabilization system protein ParE